MPQFSVKTRLAVGDLPTFESMDPFAKNLDAAIRASGLSNVEIADRLGSVSDETIRRWRKGGKYVPRLEDAVKLCDILGASLEEMVGSTSPPKGLSEDEAFALRLARSVARERGWEEVTRRLAVIAKETNVSQTEESVNDTQRYGSRS